jgi:hypothetical protein
MGLKIEIPADVWDLLHDVLPNLKAEVFNYSIGYMLPLEGLRADGSSRTPHSADAPNGMVRKNIPAIESYLAVAVGEALESIGNGESPSDAVTAALTDVANFALTTIVADTPVDTGRAWQTWTIKFPGGEFSEAPNVPLSPSKWKKPKGGDE